MKNLERQIQLLELELHIDSNRDKYCDLKTKLDNQYDHITEGIIVRSRCQWYEHGERNSKYFLGLEKRNKRKSSIYKLLINDKEIINQKEILHFILNFFQEKYSRKIQVTEKECEDFLSSVQVSSLTAEEAESCEGKLSKQEVFLSLNSMSKNKTPGNDGLPPEFYISFF